MNQIGKDCQELILRSLGHHAKLISKEVNNNIIEREKTDYLSNYWLVGKFSHIVHTILYGNITTHTRIRKIFYQAVKHKHVGITCLLLQRYPDRLPIYFVLKQRYQLQYCAANKNYQRYLYLCGFNAYRSPIEPILLELAKCNIPLLRALLLSIRQGVHPIFSVRGTKTQIYQLLPTLFNIDQYAMWVCLIHLNKIGKMGGLIYTQRYQPKNSSYFNEDINSYLRNRYGNDIIIIINNSYVGDYKGTREYKYSYEYRQNICYVKVTRKSFNELMGEHRNDINKITRELETTLNNIMKNEMETMSQNIMKNQTH